jgi:hypothetical protein
MARAKSDIANTALRIFLQEMGVAYDVERGLKPYSSARPAKDFTVVRAFFGDRCCYCDVDLGTVRTAQDHLIPMNKTSLGLHAWGNVVPACLDCNARKQAREWHAFLVERAGQSAAERYRRVTEFVTSDVAMTLIKAKIRRVSGKL